MTEAPGVRTEDRIDRGLALWRSRRTDIRRLPDGRWLVPSSRGRGEYLVDLRTGTCTCRDYRFNLALDEGGRELCKHGWAAVFEMHFRGVPERKEK